MMEEPNVTDNDKFGFREKRCMICQTSVYLQRGEEEKKQDTNIPLGFVEIYYCRKCKIYMGVIIPYE